MQIDRLSLLQKIGVYLATFLFLLFILMPFIEMIRVSLRPMSHLMTAEFSWWSEDFSFQAYRDMWTTVPLLGRYIFNSIFIASSVTVLTMIVVVPAAYAYARLEFPFKALFRVLVMPPWVIPIAIGCIGWKWMYNGYFGLISGLLQEFGLVQDRVALLATKTSAFYSAIVTDVWVGTPMVTLFFLAAMQGVSKDLYEAAWVDGAGRWYRFRRITIPQIMPVIVSMALLSAIWTFNSFEIIWILTEGGPRGATTTLIIDTYKVAISAQRFGEGAARAVVIVVLLASFSLFYLWFLNRVNRHYGAK